MAMAVTGELVYAVVHPKMPGVPDIDQAVVTPPLCPVGKPSAFNRHLAQYNRL